MPQSLKDYHSGDMSVEAYLDRLGIAPDTVNTPDLATLERLQKAHVSTIPFETLAITGDPYGEWPGTSVDLSLPALYEKIVERRRGGYCFELNGLFHWLLAELGYDVDRVAARMLREDGIRIPANHHANVVTLKQRYLVDVGTGPPLLRVPVPLDGTSLTNEMGVAWRIADSERPDVPYRLEFCRPEADEWMMRNVFDCVPRDLSYFAATNDYFQSAPESPFTGQPVAIIGTASGFRKLSGETLTIRDGRNEHERTVTGDNWYETLEQHFGLRYACD